MQGNQGLTSSIQKQEQMKKIYFLYITFLLGICAACSKSNDYGSKPGVSLPPVTNLSLQKLDSGKVKLTWGIPHAIPDAMQQPLSVNIQVNQVINFMKVVNISTATLANAPTEYVFSLPDTTGSYHFTVKLTGFTKNVDVNYSSTIFSPGQTVIYK